MKRKIFIICFLFSAVYLFCEEKIKLGVLTGPSCVPTAYLIENDSLSVKNEISVQKFSDVQTLVPKLIKNEVDIGFMPINVAAKIYNSTEKLLCCAVTGNGNLALITKQKNITQFSDLKNKTIYVAGQGAAPEYIFKYLLKKNEVDFSNPDGVLLSFSIPTAQIVPQLLTDKIQYAVVPEPFVTIAQIKSKDVIVAIDFEKEYEELTEDGKNFPFTIMVVRKAFAEKNKDLLESFLKKYEESYIWTIMNPKEAGELCEKQDFGLASNVVAVSIPKSNYTFVPAKYAQTQIEDLLNIYLDLEPSSIGEKLPDEGFFYK